MVCSLETMYDGDRREEGSWPDGKTPTTYARKRTYYPNKLFLYLCTMSVEGAMPKSGTKPQAARATWGSGVTANTGAMEPGSNGQLKVT